MPALDACWFTRGAVEAARDLIGVELTVDGVGGVIVETEAYEANDPASHSYRGPSARNAAMFGPPGTAYIYRSYGLHWCLNAVCLPGSAVLIRALAPTCELDVMRGRRGVEDEARLCAGPGRLTQALGIDLTFNGMPLDRPPFRLAGPASPVAVVSGPRIGITKAADLPWRFGLSGSRYLSRPFPSPREEYRPGGTSERNM